MERMLERLLKVSSMRWTTSLLISMFAGLLIVVLLTTVYFAYKRWSRISISQVRGPESESFLYGK